MDSFNPSIKWLFAIIILFFLIQFYNYYQKCDADCRAQQKKAREERKEREKEERKEKRAEWKAKPFGEKAKIIATNVAIAIIYLIGIALLALVFGGFASAVAMSSGYS